MMPAGTDTHLLLRAFCDELGRCGMTDACTSPGSRSSPLVLALARDPRLRTWSHVDERCCGFFALGLAKATARPVAVAVTSGTAAAELAPAVHEAREARVPLIVLTADRPPELREVGAGQTIDQIKLYGSAAKWFCEVAFERASASLRALACRAYWTALEGRAGVVHLNFPLREPLVPGAELRTTTAAGRTGPRPWMRGGRPVPAPAALERLVQAVEERARGVIVAGRWERGPDAGAGRGGPRGDRGLSPPRRPAVGRACPGSRPPTTTPSCATRTSPRPTRPSWCCGWATCRRASRCAPGWPARRTRCRWRSRPTAWSRTRTGS